MDLERIKTDRAKVILQFAIPSILAMVLTSLINIVDGFFVGNYIGTSGLAAVNLGLPIVYLYLAIGLMLAVGGISIAGRMLGAGQIKQANQVFRQTIAMCTIVTCLLSLVLVFSLGSLSALFTTDETTRSYFTIYYTIMLLELPMMVITSALTMFIRGEGKPMFVMITNLLAVILDVLFDYLFVGPLALGVAGIAWASVLSSGIVLTISILYFYRRAKVFHFGKFCFQKLVIREMIFNGSSEFIGELSMCISMAAYNYVILKKAGVEGLAAFTIIGYVSYIFSMIIVGFGQGIVPIISFSFGANCQLLAQKVRNTTMKMVALTAIVVFSVMSFAAGPYCSLFSDSNVVREFATVGLRLQMSSFAFAGINTIASFYFTAVGRAKESAVISASRGLIVLLIAIFTLPTLFGINGVWLVSLTTEAVTLVFSFCYIRKNAGEESYVIRENCN